MATEETKPVEREAFEKYARPRFSPECFNRSRVTGQYFFNRSRVTGQYFDGGVQNEYEAFVAGWDAALERAAQAITNVPSATWARGAQAGAEVVRALKGRE